MKNIAILDVRYVTCGLDIYKYVLVQLHIYIDFIR
jgi:hypothetical protein